MKRQFVAFDERLIHWFRESSGSAARIAIFIIFFWFGFLKVLDLSPAGPLVLSLLAKTMPFIAPQSFVAWFGFFEMCIGVIFLVRGYERLAIVLLAIHMVTTAGPLVLLPQITWSGFLVPTLEGQYIIKNLAIIALAFGIAAHLHPIHNKGK